MRILITGGAGFIGSNLTALLQGKADVTVLDNLRTGSLDNLQGLNYNFVGGSITNRSAVNAAMKNIDCVVHLAALTSVQESIQNIEECVEINSSGLLNVLECAQNANVKKVIFASSAAVYGDTLPTETSLLKPESPYAITKLKGEMYVSMYSECSVSFRFFNVFGPKQSPNTTYASAIPLFIKQALNDEDITIYGTGEQTRDFVFVDDIVSAIWYAINNSITGTYNVSYGKSTTINNLVNKILELTKSKSNVIHAAANQGEVMHSCGDNKKIQEQGFRFTTSFERGLIKTIKSIENSCKR